MKRFFSFALMLTLLLPSLTGIFSSIAVGAAVQDETVRYTVLILDTMGEYTITTGDYDTVVVGSSLANVKSASINFIEKIAAIGGDNYVAVVPCGTESYVECDFSDDEDDLKDTINSIDENFDGFSDVNTAFVLADELMSEAPDNAICNIVYFSGCSPAGGDYDYEGVYTEDDCSYHVTNTGIHVYAHSNLVYDTATSLFSKGYNIYTLGCVTNLEEQPENYNFFIKVMGDIANAGYYDAENPEDLEFVFGEVAEVIMSSVTGTFKYRPSVETLDNTDEEAGYFYSDNYFCEDSSTYNEHLSTMSLCLELSAFPSLEATSEEDYKNQAKNARALLQDIGFDKIMTNDDYGSKPTTETMGVLMAQKPMSDNGKKYTLVTIALRGGGYEAEWASNFVVGKDGNHEGFYKARDHVLEFIEEYLDSYVSGNVKFWVTGFSRGGAVAGLVGAWLNDNSSDLDKYGIMLSHNDIFTYTFEAPMSTDGDNLKGKNYNNIFNIVNLNDLVPKVAMTGVKENGWNFTRPGVDMILPAKGQTKGYFWKMLHMCIFINGFNSFKNEKELLEYTVEEFNDFEGGFFIEPTQYEYLNNFMNDFCHKISREEYAVLLQEPLTEILSIIMADGLTKKQKDILIPGLIEDFFEYLDALKKGTANNNGTWTEQLSMSLAENLKAADVVSETGPTAFAIKKLLDAILSTEIQIDSSGNAVTYPSLLKGILVIVSQKVFNAHYPELCLAWLMSQDSYYNGDKATKAFVPADSVVRIVRINCPVDVTVYDADGNVVAQFTDNVAEELDEYSLYALMHNGEKLIYIPSDGEYTIEITATAEGKMSYSVEEYLAATGETKRSVSYLDISLTEGETFSAIIPQSRDESGETYEVTYTLADGEGELEPDVDAADDEIEDAKCTVNAEAEDGHGVVVGDGEYLIGKRATLSAYGVGCYVFEGWYLDGEKVSDDAEYQFVAKEDVTYTAKFSGKHTPEDDWIIDKEPKVGVAGEKHISCTECGEVIKTATIDPLPDEKDNKGENKDNGKKDSEQDVDKTDDYSFMSLLPSNTVLIVIFAVLAVLLIAAVTILVIVIVKRRSR